MRDNIVVHRYPAAIRISLWFAFVMWCVSAVGFVFAIGWSLTTPLENLFAYPVNESAVMVRLLTLIVTGGISGGLLLFFSVLLLQAVTASPTIISAPYGFQVVSLIHRTEWMPWSAVKRVHTPLLLSAVYLAVPALPAVYLLHGWVLFNMRAVLVHSSASRYDIFEARLRENRPELFEERK